MKVLQLVQLSINFPDGTVEEHGFGLYHLDVTFLDEAGNENFGGARTGSVTIKAPIPELRFTGEFRDPSILGWKCKVNMVLDM